MSKSIRLSYSLLPCFPSRVAVFFVSLEMSQLIEQLVGLFRGLLSTIQARLPMSVCATSNGNTKKYERLSTKVKPVHYSLQLTPCLKTFALKGKVEIDVDVKEGMDSVKLHSDGLNVTKAEITVNGGNVLSDCRVEYGNELLTVTPASAIAPGKAKISLEFAGELRNHAKGFYRSTYKKDGEEKILASTQFEATFARQAFPCFDEPALKATFDVQLTVDKNLTALSNMNVQSEEEKGDVKEVKFATTPIMSTYLLAFAVGELEYIETKTEGGVVIRVYTIPGKKEHGQFSLHIAKRAIEWYGQWFAIPYALPKCDLIAIPDFHMGAMENWGLVTFREVALLFDKEKTSNRQKAYIALVVAHELAHLWFGDLVTMVWWTDLWLKEGFASFMEYLFVGHNYEEYKIWLRFARDEISSGMDLDALKSSHPIEVHIDNPNELDEIYDSITYAKSNCVNRMLCEYLGEETFQKGLRIYLKRHSYANATTVDLWEALSEASGQDIKKMMSGWTQQMGYPLVTVTDEKREGGSVILKLSQKRFIADGSSDGANSKWSIPVTSIVGPNAKQAEKSLFADETGSITITAGASDYVKLNSNTGGFYRVAYPESMFDELTKAFLTLPPLDRFGFASDTFALMVSGEYSAKQFLTLLSSCTNEAEYAVWGALDDGLSSLSSVLERGDEALNKRLNAFVIKTMAPLMGQLGYVAQAAEDSQRGQLRALVMNRLARSGHQETIDAALGLFNKTGIEQNADTRQTILGIVARHGDESQWNNLKKVFETCGFSEIERNCIAAMAQTQDERLFDDYLDYAFKQGKVRSQDLCFLVAGSSSTRFGQEKSWEFFKKDQSTILAKLGGTKDSLYQRAFKCAADGFCTEAKAKEVESFFCSCSDLNADSVASLNRPIRQVTETIRLNARLLSDNAKEIEAFLSEKGF